MAAPKILLGVTGSIAAVKAPEIVRLFRDNNIEVRCVLTAAGAQFVSPLALSSLSGERVLGQVFHDDCYQMQHLRWAEEAHIMVIAPATASILAKCAYGLADDMVSLTYLSVKAPVVMAPAMHTPMWEHTATRHNVGILKERGVHFVGPYQGPLADQTYGDGRMAEPQEILAVVQKLLHKGS